MKERETVSGFMWINGNINSALFIYHFNLYLRLSTIKKIQYFHCTVDLILVLAHIYKKNS